MRIVHTSDWHAGRLWKNLRRLDELEAALVSLADFVATQDVDLVLVSGDVFDNGAPVAEAARQTLTDGLRHIAEQLCPHFHPSSVNLLMAHTHVHGAVLSGSEREVHIG